MSNAISVTHMQSELNVQDNQTNFQQLTCKIKVMILNNTSFKKGMKLNFKVTDYIIR